MDQFDHENYEKLLKSLTINSRAVITELATLAEQNVDKAQEICDMIETRIKKALPQHKLYVMYLLDSICKNIGSPYNLLFAKNLFKVFTETYTVVPDTATRQNLINLFKTWTTAKTGTGSPLFPVELIKKIEKFIINATSINNSNNDFSQNSTANIASGAVAGSNTFFKINLARLTPDMLLREARVLLTYNINIDNAIEKLDIEDNWLNEKDKKVLSEMEIRRNQLVWSINDLTDKIVTFLSRREDFDKNFFHNSFVGIRRVLDDQSFILNEIKKRISPKLRLRKLKEDMKKSRVIHKQEFEEFFKLLDVEIDLDPKGNHDNTLSVNVLGKINGNLSIESDPFASTNKSDPFASDFDDFGDDNDDELTNLLGFDIGSFGSSSPSSSLFDSTQQGGSVEEDPYVIDDVEDFKIKSPTPINYQTGQDAEDDDDYVPYEPIIIKSPTRTIPLKSSLKRQQEAVAFNNAKRVRFEV